jgi:hypothetical protein
LSAPTTITTGFAMEFPNTRPDRGSDRQVPIPALGANMAETRDYSIP